MSGRRVAAAIAAAAALAFGARAALAHQVGLSRGEYAFARGELVAEIIFARGELLEVVPALDTKGDGKLTAREIEAGSEAIARAVVPRIAVSTDAGACTGELEATHLTEEDGALVRLRFRCKAAAPKAKVELAILDDLSFGHRHIARARTARGDVEQVLYGKQRVFEVPEGGPVPPRPALAPMGTPPVDARSEAAPPSASPFRDGARCAWGLAHVAFLAGIVLPCVTRRRAALAALAFAIGELVAIACASLGVWSPEARVLAPALAASIAWIGLDNLTPVARPPRPLAGGAFGLAHGFALASIGASLSSPLLFAVGALGATLLAAAPLVFLAVNISSDETRSRLVARASGALMMLVGLAWLVRAVVL